MIEYVLIDQIQEAFDQFNRVCLFIRKFLIYICFQQGQKYLYSTLTTTIKDNQTNVTSILERLMCVNLREFSRMNT